MTSTVAFDPSKFLADLERQMARAHKPADVRCRRGLYRGIQPTIRPFWVTDKSYAMYGLPNLTTRLMYGHQGWDNYERDIGTIMDDTTVPQVQPYPSRICADPNWDVYGRMSALLYEERYDPTGMARYNTLIRDTTTMETVYHKSNSDLEFPLEPTYINRFGVQPVFRVWEVVDGISSAPLLDMFIERLTAVHTNMEKMVCYYRSHTHRHEKTPVSTQYVETVLFVPDLHVMISLLTGYDNTMRIVVMGQEEPEFMTLWKECIDQCSHLVKKPDHVEPMFNIIVREGSGYGLREFSVAKLEDADFIATNYNDDFAVVADDIVKSLRERTKGITLLYGEPGTGKTNFIRYLANQVNNKTIIYIPPELTAALADPSFISFIMDNPKSIFIVEDAENVIRSREAGGSNAVANILNMSDGIIGDAVQCQFVCTFNCEYEEVDSALKRKGRLNAAYKFGKLQIEKAQSLATKLYGNSMSIDQPKTLAEVYNMDTPEYNVQIIQRKSVGFICG